MSQGYLGLFDTPPTRQQVRLGLAIVGLFAAFLFILPFRDVRLAEIDGFVPMIDTVVFPCELIAAAMLYAQAGVFRSRALTVLGTVYVYTALLLIPHALSFPGAFAHGGLLNAGVNTASWLVLLRQAAFPVGGFLYIMFKQADSAAQPGTKPSAGIAVGVVAAVVLALAVTLLTTVGHGLLPPFFVNRADAVQPLAAAYESVVFTALLLVTVLLFRKRTSVLDMWLLVAFCGFLIQILMIMSLRSRFTAGWYGVYLLTLFSYMVVTIALIAESNRAHARLALATSARNRERETQLMSLDTMVAAISHEAGQPLAAIGIHARAGLNRLARPRPDVGKVIASLNAIIDAGHSATDVIKSMRPAVVTGPDGVIEFNLNDLARSTASMLERELAAAKVALQLSLDESLPPILADRIKLQRVLVNLLANGIESLGATRGRPRRIVIRTTVTEDHDVTLEVSDNGAGIAPEHMERIFEPFFTTKATGVGLGLSLSRTIIETHGGRLLASPGDRHGARFHIQLPACAASSLAVEAGRPPPRRGLARVR
jgi:signal transduction histidine kinase